MLAGRFSCSAERCACTTGIRECAVHDYCYTRLSVTTTINAVGGRASAVSDSRPAVSCR